MIRLIKLLVCLCFLRQDFQTDLAKPHILLSSAVQPQNNDAVSIAIRIFQVDAGLAIDECADVITFRDHFIRIPVAVYNVAFSGPIPG